MATSAEICSTSGSHTALGTAQLYHHRLLSLWMYQVTLQTHKASHRKVVLHQSVLMSSSVLSNKSIQSISHTAKGLICPAAGNTHIPGKHQLQSCGSAWCLLAGCSTSTSSRNSAWSYKHFAWFSFLYKALTSLMHLLHPSVLWLNRTYNRIEPGTAKILMQWMNISYFQPKNIFLPKSFWGRFP